MWRSYFRLRVLRQPDLGPGCDPGNEWFSNWHEATKGPAEAAKGRSSALLTRDAVPARFQRARKYTKNVNMNFDIKFKKLTHTCLITDNSNAVKKFRMNILL